MILVLDEGYRAAVDGRFSQCDVRFFPNTLKDAAAFAEHARPANVLGLRRALPFPFDRQLISALPNVQFIHKSGSGADWFDVEALTDSGIMLAVNTGFNAASVAEHTMMLTLTCMRGARGFMDDLHNGRWVQKDSALPPALLEGKTVGIIGLGSIGSRVAQMMLSFGTNVLAYQRQPRSLPKELAAVTWVPLTELLQSSDIITLHVPHTAETNSLIGCHELALMKPGATLINTSRGKVVDERALYEALRDGRLRAAGLDVFEQEPTPADNPLLQLPNVCATPHVGGGALELEARQTEGTLANIELFLSGNQPERLVNPEVLNR